MRIVVFLELHWASPSLQDWGSLSLEAPASSATGPGRQRCIPRSGPPAKPRAPGMATRDLGLSQNDGYFGGP